MKKIIYSLVIMIAASCLFTSCVETKVDEGRQDLLKAKAAYLNALSNLRAADAEKVKAEAAFIQAQTATEQAVAALKQAEVEAKKIANEAAQAATDEAVAKAKAQIEAIKAKAEIAAVENAKALAKAQADLDSALRAITAASYGLTEDEAKAIKEATDNYKKAAKKFGEAELALFNAQKALWSLEYDHAAGYDTIAVNYSEQYKTKLAANYEDSIKNAKERIAVQEALIAASADTVNNFQVLKDWVASLDAVVDSLNADTKKYQAAVTLTKSIEVAEANIAIQKKIDEYKEEYFVSAPYKFKEFKQKFEVKNSFNLIGYFNTKLTDGNPYAVSPRYVYEYNATTRKAQITVAESTVSGPMDTLLNGKGIEYLGMNGVMDALNREMVILSDSTAKTAEIAKAKADYEKADSLYTAQRDIFENHGYDTTFPGYKDSLAKFNAKKDTFNVKKAAQTAAYAVLSADSLKAKTDIKAAAKLFKEASADFVKAVNDIKSREGGFYGGVSKSDSAAFIAAAKKLGVAKAAFYGFQDSLKLISIDPMGEKTTTAVAFSDLEESGFVLKLDPVDHAGRATSLYGAYGWGKFANSATYGAKAWYPINANKKSVTNKLNDAFTAVATIALSQNKEAFSADYVEVFDKDGNQLDDATCFDWTTVEAKQYAEAWPDYYKPEKSMGYEISDVTSYYTDTLEFYAVMVANAEGKGDAPSKAVFTEPIAADYAAIAATKKVCDKADEAVGKAVTDTLNAWNNVLVVENKYIDMFKSFFGLASMTDDEKKAALGKYKFNYTRKTFEGESGVDDIVYFDGYNVTADEAIAVGTPEYNIVFEQIKGRAPYAPLGVTYNSQYAKLLFQKQKYAIVSEWTSVDAQLEALNAAVTKINTKHVEAKAAEKAAQDANTAAQDSLRGKGFTTDVDNFALTDAMIEDGAWKLGGLLKVWADELAPNYPVVYAASASAKSHNDTYAGYLGDVKTTVNTVFADQISAYDRQEALVNSAKAAIESENTLIDIYNKALAMIKAGYDAYSIKLQTYQAVVAACEAKLADAKVKFDYYKSVYEQVIAAYLK